VEGNLTRFMTKKTILLILNGENEDK
jgi:hypothetical protein